METRKSSYSRVSHNGRSNPSWMSLTAGVVNPHCNLPQNSGRSDQGTRFPERSSFTQISRFGFNYWSETFRMSKVQERPLVGATTVASGLCTRVYIDLLGDGLIGILSFLKFFSWLRSNRGAILGFRIHRILGHVPGQIFSSATWPLGRPTSAIEIVFGSSVRSIGVDCENDNFGQETKSHFI
jgi:hypothetical protein